MEGLLSLITAPAGEPLAVEDARVHLRVDGSDEDILIASHIQAATAWAENYTRRALITQTWELWLDCFPTQGDISLAYDRSKLDVIELPLPPLRTVGSVKYYDTAGLLQTFSAGLYIVTAPAGPQAERGSIRLAPSASWPATQERPNAVIVRFDAGYGAAEDVPAAVKAGMLLVVGELYKNREQSVTGNISKVPLAAEHLLDPFRSLRVV